MSKVFLKGRVVPGVRFPLHIKGAPSERMVKLPDVPGIQIEPGINPFGSWLQISFWLSRGMVTGVLFFEGPPEQAGRRREIVDRIRKFLAFIGQG